jgi:tRNA threonylcarbamoyladenosine biosynthesis protein TsaB
MKLLALETATEACSAALMIDDVIESRYRFAPREHGALILTMVDELLSEAGLPVGRLDAIAFGRGPGAFTGVRIATGVVQGLAYGADVPVVPVSTLAALAQGGARASQASHLLAAIDARMEEVYWGVYETGTDGLVTLVGEESVCAPHAVTAPAGSWAGVGSGWLNYETAMRNALQVEVTVVLGEMLPNAREVALLGAAAFRRGVAVTAEAALPVYLRDQVAWRKVDRSS